MIKQFVKAIITRSYYLNCLVFKMHIDGLVAYCQRRGQNYIILELPRLRKM